MYKVIEYDNVVWLCIRDGMVFKYKNEASDHENDLNSISNMKLCKIDETN